MAYVFECPTRWGDMDVYGHLNNASYVDFLQEARVDFLHGCGFAYLLGDEPAPGTEGPNSQAILVTGHQIEYLEPAAAGLPVRVRLVVDQLGAARFTLAYDLFSGDRQVARARTVLCPFDLDTSQIRRLASVERAWLARYAESVDPLPAIDKVRVADHPAHDYPLRVRWSDLDSYRHANNVKFFDYVQEGRIRLLQDLLAHQPDGAERPGQWIVVRQDMDYLAQLDFRPQPYLVRTAVQQIGRSSLTLAAEIVDPGTPTTYASARTVLVHTARGGAVPIPQWLREAVGSGQLRAM